MRSENPPMEHRLAGREKTPGDFRGISTLIGISPRGISYQRSGEAVDFPWNTHPSSKSDTANHQKTKKGNILSISQRLRDIEKWYSIMIFNLKENYGKLWYPRYAIKACLKLRHQANRDSWSWIPLYRLRLAVNPPIFRHTQIRYVVRSCSLYT
jgi:hypothetical protein